MGHSGTWLTTDELCNFRQVVQPLCSQIFPPVKWDSQWRQHHEIVLRTASMHMCGMLCLVPGAWWVLVGHSRPSYYCTPLALCEPH